MPVAGKSSILQMNGQVTRPGEFREKYGLKKGDEAVFRGIAGGLLIDARVWFAAALLARRSRRWRGFCARLAQAKVAGRGPILSTKGL